MSVADQGALSVKQSSDKPILWLSPRFVNRIAIEVQEFAEISVETVGLLFGEIRNGLLCTEAFRSFSTHGGSGKQQQPEYVDELVGKLLAEAQADQELSRFNLVGWYSVRQRQGLQENDVTFHNRHFRKSSDVVLILTRDEQHDISLEAYNRSQRGLLTIEEHRYGRARVSGMAPLADPIEIRMRSRVTDEVYFNTYKSLELIVRADRQERRQKVVRSAKNMVASVFSPKRSDANSTDNSEKKESSRELVRRSEEENQRPRRWKLWTALFAGAIGILIAVVMYISSASTVAPGVSPRPVPKSELGLRVDGDSGRIHLTWNRQNPIVRSASEGILRIEDGAVQRTLHLDPDQVANGSIVYSGTSENITLRLQVRSQQGEIIKESVQVLDGHDQHATEITALKSAPDSTTPAAIGLLPKPEAGPIPANDIRTPVRLPAERVSSPNPASQHTPAARAPETKTSDTASAANLGSRNIAPTLDTNLEWHDPMPRITGLLNLNLNLGDGPTASAPPPSRTPPPSQSPPATPNSPDVHAPALRTESASSIFSPPQPLRQVLPEMRRISPLIARPPGEIQVQVIVDKSGRVLAAHVVGKPPNLTPALSSAVLIAAKQWIFKPALLHGAPVNSDHIIIFQFPEEKR